MANARKRPRSRDSTASMHSVTTQPRIDHSFSQASDVYPAQWLNDGLAPSMASSHGQHRELAPAPHHHHHQQMTPEDLLLASQLQSGRDYMDSSMGNSMHNASFSQGHNVSRQSMSADSFAGNGSFVDDSQMMDRDGHDEGDSFVGAPLHAKSGSRTSANNEQEMRQLFNSNKHRGLQDVAQELHGNERGPNSERTRQVFAMLWINQVCSKGKGSVPRGRVYANYASKCATERITVLNPASFGKLVRVLFPGLKTRRLGVRGESKYHYVNFTLMEDAPDFHENTSHSHIPLGEPASFTQSFNTLPNTVQSAPSERVSFAVPDAPLQPPLAQVPRSHEFSHSLYNQTMLISMDQLQSTRSKTPQTLTFCPELTQPLQPSETLVLPPIEQFLPAGTDPDAAKSLTALYRSHCTSLVECMRYCKEKTFFHLFTSFQGTLTMPVQKLFGNPAIAPWVEECDFILYQRMMRIISILTLQVIPKPVLDTLRNISSRLVPHIRESFQGQPLHVIRAKEAPATLFASLLDKALRVNLTAHAAANMLSNPANRDLMYLDWVTLIDIRKIAESVPTRGMDDVVMVLLTEMRDLLDPAEIPWDAEANIYGEVALLREKRSLKHGVDNSVSTIIERWVKFMQSLPERFPYASHTDIVWCVQRVGTTIMRDLTLQQGKSFGSWWVTKCWVDEQIQFMAEHGGFMKQTSAEGFAARHPPAAARNGSNSASRYSSTSDDFNMTHVSQSQPDRAPFPSAPSNGNDSVQNHANPDDSGIGIRTPDEELPPMDDKFSFTPAANTQDLFDGTELAGM